MGDCTPIVKMDEKGRIQLPHEVREAWKLKPRQALIVEMKQNTISVRKARKLAPEADPLLRDILLRPGHSKIKVTRALLRKLEDEAWTP